MSVAAHAQTSSPWCLSIIIEWANTVWNGDERAIKLLDRLSQEWLAIRAGRYPNDLPATAVEFLRRCGPSLELLIVSGSAGVRGLEANIRSRMPESVDVSVHVAEGLEYYPLKNFGARLARGDFLLFVDCDVLPEEDWLAHLIGSFGRPEVDAVCGQTYVAPTDLVTRAFALGWTYPLRDPAGHMVQAGKFYANNLAFRTQVFRETEFPSIGVRTRGASSMIQTELGHRGIPIWENSNARVDHPPPSSFRHLAVRGLAHGRDVYMKRSQDRNMYGLMRSVGIAGFRLGRGVYRTFRSWRRVGLKAWELPAAIAIFSSYYAFFALGGVLTHVNPTAMGRRFRV